MYQSSRPISPNVPDVCLAPKVACAKSPHVEGRVLEG